MLTHICFVFLTLSVNLVQPQVAETFTKKDKIKEQKTYLSKSAQPSQNTTANPSRVLSLWRRKNLYPHVLDGQPLHLSQQTVAKALGERAAARKHNVGVECLAQVQVCPVDGVHDDLVHAGVLEANDFGIKEDLGGSESLGSDLDLFINQ